MVRIMAAVVMGIAGLAAIWYLPTLFFGVLLIVLTGLGLNEYAKMFFQDELERWGVFAAGLVMAAMLIFTSLDTEFVVLFIILAVFLLSLLFIWRAAQMNGVASKLGLAILGMIYLGLAFPFWGWLRGMTMGREFVLMALVPACLCDSFGYIVGKTLGKRKFAPLVSPNKTWEGFAGALLGSLIGTFIVKWALLPSVPWTFALGLALIVWMTSPLGDLIESMMKRSCGVKDSGNIIPGHGGILDRFDALIFTGPAAYAFVKYVIGV